MNSMPQQEVANGRGQMEFFLANPTTLLKFVAKKPSPWWPYGISAILISPSRGFSLMLYDTGRGIIINLKISKCENVKMIIGKLKQYPDNRGHIFILIIVFQSSHFGIDTGQNR